MPNEFVARNGVIALNDSQVTGSLKIQGVTDISPTISTTNHLLKLSDNVNGTARMGFSSTAATGFFIGSNNALTIGRVTADNSNPSTTNATIVLNTSAGASKLDLSTNSANTGISFSDGNNGTIRMNFPSANETALTTISTHNLSIGVASGVGSLSSTTMKFFQSTSNVAIGTTSDAGFKFDVSGSTRFNGNSQITGSLNVSAGITGSLFGTASWASNAVTSSYILSAVSASFASTASYVNPLIQTVTVTGSLNISGSENVRGSGSAVFTVDGTSGRLFSVDDSLSGSLFSVNTAAGLPVVEAFSDNTVRIGQYGQRALFVSQSRVGIGKETALNAVLDVSGSTTMTGSLTVGAFTSSFAGPVGIGTTTPSYSLDISGTARINYNDNAYKEGLTISNTNSGTSALSGVSFYTNGVMGGFMAYIPSNYTSAPQASTMQFTSTGLNKLGFIANSSQVGATAQDIYFSTFGGNTTYQMQIKGNGNVQIGTNTDSGFKFDVNGTTRFNGNSQITGSLTITGSGTTSATTALLIQSSNRSASLQLTDDGAIKFIDTNSSVAGTNYAAFIPKYSGNNVALGFYESGTTPNTLRFVIYRDGSNIVYLTTIGGNVFRASPSGATLPGTLFVSSSLTAGSLISNTHSITGSLNITGSITTTGTITAQTLVVQTITSSTDFVTGSTRFGSLLSNTHQFTGSVSMTGSLTTVGTASFGGPVGIGTSTPSQQLEVAGDALIRNTYVGYISAFGTNYASLSHTSRTGTGDYSLLSENNGTTYLNASTGQTLKFRINNIDKAILDSSGNFGIGTTSPSYTLDVSGIIRSTSTVLSKAATNGNGLTVLNSSNNNIFNLYANGTDDGVLQILNAAGVQKAAINGNDGSGTFLGNVGFGLAAAATSIEINKTAASTEIIGSANNPAIRIKNTNSAAFNEKAEVQFTIGNSVLPTAAISNLYTSYTAGTQQGGDLVFSTRVAGSTLDERMRILAAGNVGIGTTSPSNLFEVNGISAVVNSYGAFTALQASGSTGYRWTLANDASFRLQYTTNGFAGLAGTPMYVSSSGNVGIGTTSPSLKLDVSGSDAIFNGVRVGRGVSNIGSNTVVGAAALFSNTTGYNNVALGNGASGLNTTGNNNTAVGAFPLYANTTGFNNTAMGVQALTSNTTGNNNTALGLQSMFSNTTGVYNTAIGIIALYSNTTGTYNTVIGSSALSNNTTGGGNIAIGSFTGITDMSDNNNETSANSIYIGNGILPLANGDTNEVIIGQDAFGNGSNSVTLGNDSIEKTILKGYVGIGLTTPGYPLEINGNVSDISIYATNDIVAYSDESVKTNLEIIPNAIDKIKQINGYTFERTDNDNKRRRAGVIAQEVEKILPEVIAYNTDGTLGVAYGNMVALLIECIKEQQIQIDELKSKING